MPKPGFALGAQEALGAPALAMAATFLAFGAAVREAGLALPWALGAAWLVYGMPGQLVLLDFATPGGPGGGVVAAVAAATAANARFLPMAVALAPWLGAGRRRWWALPFIAITPWAAAMRRLPMLPAGPNGAARLGWFLGFGLVSWLVAGAATAAGHLAAPWLGSAVRSALLFTNPLYFALLLTLNLKLPEHGRIARLSVLGGVLAAPVALLLPPAWALLGAGLLGGTGAFILHLWLEARHGRG